jgi:hypothetical protein
MIFNKKTLAKQTVIALASVLVSIGYIYMKYKMPYIPAIKPAFNMQAAVNSIIVKVSPKGSGLNSIQI